MPGGVHCGNGDDQFNERQNELETCSSCYCHHTHNVRLWTFRLCIVTCEHTMNKKVLLRKRERHTARRVASARYVALSSGGCTPSQGGGYPQPGLDGGGVPHPRSWWWGVGTGFPLTLGKPGKMREVFPVREKSGNFRISPESQGKVMEFFISQGKVREN